MTPKISVVVPVYNIEQYISRCIDSILAQTYDNLEVIIVDDGSSDQSGNIVDEYAKNDARVSVIHQENSGVTLARFNGMRAATGEWIGFVDGDDYIEPDMYERLLFNALKYGADISHCGYKMVFPSRVDYYYNTGRLAEQDGPTGLYDLLDGSFVEPGLCNKLFNNSLLHSLFHSGMEQADIRINEDLLMNYYLFAAAQKSVYEDFCPYHYIVRKGSAANSKHKKHNYTDPMRVGEILVKNTSSDKMLNGVAMRYCTRTHMRAVLQKHHKDISKQAKIRLKTLWKSEHLPKKEKLLACMVAYCAPLYRFLHSVYNLFTGVGHTYDID